LPSFYRLSSVAGFMDDLQIGFPVDKELETLPYRLVILDQQNPHASGSLLPRRVSRLSRPALVSVGDHVPRHADDAWKHRMDQAERGDLQFAGAEMIPQLTVEPAGNAGFDRTGGMPAGAKHRG
jgi:hypothetical protein